MKTGFKHCVGLLGILLSLSVFTVFAKETGGLPGSGRPRVAILHGVFGKADNPAHHIEYDYALGKLGWESVKYSSRDEDMLKLTGPVGDEGNLGELPNYDIIAFCPLFNYVLGRSDLVEIDTARYAPKLRKFIENGGAVIFTDTMYPHLYKWLPSLDESLRFSVAPCSATHAIQNVAPLDGLRSVPNLLREDNERLHYVLPAKHGWKVIANCGEGAPECLLWRLGKGFLYVSMNRIYTPDFFENFRANLGLSRMGMEAISFQMGNLTIGKNSLRIALTNAASTTGSVVGSLSVIPSEGQGKPLQYKRRLVIREHGAGMLSLPFDNPYRGKVRFECRLIGGGGSAVLFDRLVDIPPLLTVSGPRYRGIAVESSLKASGKIMAVVDIAPYKENLRSLQLRLSVHDKAGKEAGVASGKVPARHFLVPVKVGRLPVGAYTLKAELTQFGSTIGTAEVALPVISDQDCPVYINDDMNFVVHGKEFFPLGIYHVHPDDVAAVAELGFNTVQMFSWFEGRAFTVPAEHGMMVLYEQNFRLGGDEWIGQTGGALSKKYSNILMWYGMDEPLPPSYDTARRCYELYRKYDYHPVFVPSYAKCFYHTLMDTGDVFAPDTYPYSNIRRPISVISEHMEAIRDATKGEKPFLYVPQCFGHEPPEVLRNMAYQGVVHEARGLIWYPWFDDPGNGLKNNNHPELRQHEVIKGILGELKTLSPALLNKRGRKRFQSENGMIHGLLCQEKSGRKYVLLVNLEDKENAIRLTGAAGLQSMVQLRDFHDQTKKTSAALPIAMAPLEVRIFSY